MSFGYIYVLVNNSLPYLKIGYTTRSPEVRAAELTSTGVPSAFRVAYKAYVANCEEIERKIHTSLREHRVSSNREFFEIDITTAVSKIDEIINNVNSPPDTLYFSDFDPKQYILKLKEQNDVLRSEQELLIESNMNEAKNYLSRVYELLQEVNGFIDDNGNKVIYSLDIDNNSISIIKEIHICELPEEFGRFDDLYEYFNPKYDKAETRFTDPKLCAKRILTETNWCNEAEISLRLNPGVDFLDAIREGWERYCSDTSVGYASEDFESEFFVFLDECWLDFIIEFCARHDLADIVLKSWKMLPDFMTETEEYHAKLLSFIKFHLTTK
ncbi:GIY-YIG nuclease family protein [Methylomonas sp. EFPC3]|uniref:GIY-YIG nuclease family protein n=1 Tax=Methylomonas sp. EFPC3 TaxID=3021710 RepID=UPI0024167DD6|nr:GIY-YIG nuclease family protein [Methylomonas sp. EFPC3]WFP49785.1 GIY-YIG nuclease family protein [Methylomonas sp. EFPC3]